MVLRSPANAMILDLNRNPLSLSHLQEETDLLLRRYPRLTPVHWTLFSYSQLLLSPVLPFPISFQFISVYLTILESASN